MNLILFFTILIVSFITVRIGAIAFELTGLEWSLAKFQSLSCFTGTGFTTKEAELITGDPQRRRIASVLIVLGHAGFVTLIATFANSLRTDTLFSKLTLPFVHSVIPGKFSPLVNLVIIIVVLYFMYRIFTNTRLVAKFTNLLRARIIKKGMIRRVTFEELVVATGGYGITKVEICKDSPIIDKSLIDSALRKSDISVLAVQRGHEVIANPPADTRIVLGDKLICFGKLGTMKDKLCGSAA